MEFASVEKILKAFSQQASSMSNSAQSKEIAKLHLMHSFSRALFSKEKKFQIAKPALIKINDELAKYIDAFFNYYRLMQNPRAQQIFLFASKDPLSRDVLQAHISKIQKMEMIMKDVKSCLENENAANDYHQYLKARKTEEDLFTGLQKELLPLIDLEEQQARKEKNNFVYYKLVILRKLRPSIVYACLFIMLSTSLLSAHIINQSAQERKDVLDQKAKQELIAKTQTDAQKFSVNKADTLVVNNQEKKAQEDAKLQAELNKQFHVPAGYKIVKIIDAKLTAYSADTTNGDTLGLRLRGAKYSGRTATGTDALICNGVAVDFKLIPKGTVIGIPGIGPKIADDTGGIIRKAGKKGKVIIDVRFPTTPAATAFGHTISKIAILARA
jgi:3D (Asp-Asp-Asp) domain-containing protein